MNLKKIAPCGRGVNMPTHLYPWRRVVVVELNVAEVGRTPPKSTL